MLPADLIRELLSLALQARASPDAFAATFEAQMSGMQDAATYDDAYDTALAGDEEGVYGGTAGGAMRVGEEEDDEDVESEGGVLGADDDADDMLGQLEEIRGVPEQEEEEYGLGGEEGQGEIGGEVFEEEFEGEGAGGRGFMTLGDRMDDDEVGRGAGGYEDEEDAYEEEQPRGRGRR